MADAQLKDGRRLDPFGLARHPPEEVENPPADGVVRLLRHREPGDLVQVVDGQLAGDAIGGRVDTLHQPFRLVVLVGNLADDFLQQVFEGHEPRGPAVFVDHDREVQLLRLEFLEERVGPLRLRHEVRRMQVGP